MFQLTSKTERLRACRRSSALAERLVGAGEVGLVCELDEATSKVDPTCSLSEAAPDIGIGVERELEAISTPVSSVLSGVSFRFGGGDGGRIGS